MPIRPKIHSRADRDRFIAADLRARGVERWTLRHRFSGRNQDRILRYQRRMRQLEYLEHVRPGHPLALRLRLAVLWRLHARHAERLGYTIPLHVFGPGLELAHYGPIVMSTEADIGANCRVHPGAVVGTTDDGGATIGDRAYLGPGAKVIGPVTLGDDVAVGANAVVTRSFGDRVSLGGIPAKVIAEREPGWTH